MSETVLRVSADTTAPYLSLQDAFHTNSYPNEPRKCILQISCSINEKIGAMFKVVKSYALIRKLRSKTGIQLTDLIHLL
ncbi:hypothetical protein T4D_9386 [Trichinella pseudospiralis]|nr:hypothetical protein T4D_9386 [Trichinella pseudospiralis]